MKFKSYGSMILLLIMSGGFMACGESGKHSNEGLFSELTSKYAKYDGKENFAETAAKVFEGKTIPVEVDSGVPLSVEAMQFDTRMLSDGDFGTYVRFVGNATLKRAGVFDATTAWAEPQNDDEAYDFYWRIGMLMFDNDGNPVYIPEFNFSGLQKSGLKRIINPQGTSCSYICGFKILPYNQERIGNIAKVLLIDLKGERADQYNQQKEEQDKEMKAFQNS